MIQTVLQILKPVQAVHLPVHFRQILQFKKYKNAMLQNKRNSNTKYLPIHTYAFMQCYNT